MICIVPLCHNIVIIILITGWHRSQTNRDHPLIISIFSYSQHYVITRHPSLPDITIIPIIGMITITGPCYAVIIGSHYLAPQWWQVVHYLAPQKIWWHNLHCSAPWGKILFGGSTYIIRHFRNYFSKNYFATLGKMILPVYSQSLNWPELGTGQPQLVSRT